MPNTFSSRMNGMSPSTLLPEPSQLPAGGISGAAVGGAIAALLILIIFVAGITILIVVLVRRRNARKSTMFIVNHQDDPSFINPLYVYQGNVASILIFLSNFS